MRFLRFWTQNPLEDADFFARRMCLKDVFPEKNRAGRGLEADFLRKKARARWCPERHFLKKCGNGVVQEAIFHEKLSGKTAARGFFMAFAAGEKSMTGQ